MRSHSRCVQRLQRLHALRVEPLLSGYKVDIGELFLDEDVEYAQRLALAGVPVEFHIYPRAFHGCSLLAPRATLSQRLQAEWNQELRHAWAS